MDFMGCEYILAYWYYVLVFVIILKWRGQRRLTGLESNNLFTRNEGFSKIPNRKSYRKINKNDYKMN